MLMVCMLLIAYAAKLVVIMSVLTAVHDNSQAFEEYLEVSGLRHALDKSQLRRRAKHTIFPPVSSTAYRGLCCDLKLVCSQRLCVPIEAKRSALPEFPDDESWYFWVSYQFYNFFQHPLNLCFVPRLVSVGTAGLNVSWNSVDRKSVV